MTYVTCPTLRYHPAVVAQKAATLQILADGRFTLGLGQRENLNEHVVGERLAGDRASARTCSPRRSRSSARCTPASSSTTAATSSRSTPPGSGTCPTRASRSASPSPATGRSSASRRWPTTSSAVEPEADARRDVERRRRARRRSARTPGRSARSRSAGTPTRTTAIARAHEQFRWFGGGWSVNADLPTPAGFSGATTYVRPEDVAESIPCGPDLDAVVEAVSAYWEAGFTDVALVQVGDEGQDRFLGEAAGPLLEKLRARPV